MAADPKIRVNASTSVTAKGRRRFRLAFCLLSLSAIAPKRLNVASIKNKPLKINLSRFKSPALHFTEDEAIALHSEANICTDLYVSFHQRLRIDGPIALS